MDGLPKLSRLGYCCFLTFSLALASTLVYIIIKQGMDIANKIDGVNTIQQTSTSQLTCTQICRNDYISFNTDEGDSCCMMEMVSNCLFKSVCKNDYVSSQKLEISSMLSNLYFEIGFLAFVALLLTVFLCYKRSKRRQQQRMMRAANDNLQERIHDILQRMNTCNEPLIAGTKQQLSQSQFADNMSDTCAICLEEFQERKVIKLNCAHTFHSRCIEEWITHNARCPVCRARQ